MKILSTQQIRDADAFTIENEPVLSIDLMERASEAFVAWFVANFKPEKSLFIFCGLGNNGGDGLAISRLLLAKGYPASPFAVWYSHKTTEDFSQNLERLQAITHVPFVQDELDMPSIPPDCIVIDALMGTGLSRAIDGGLLKTMIDAINESLATVISVDIASGLFADTPNQETDVIVKPDFTVAFQVPKLAFMMPQNQDFVGEWHLMDIGLHPDFLAEVATSYFYTNTVQLKKRGRFSHKGTHGHAMIIGGSYGSLGAAVLAAKACLRSGVGLLTVQVPACGYEVLQTTVPEALCSPDKHERFIGTMQDYFNFSAIGLGIGLGKRPETARFLATFLENIRKPLVLDADVLNLLAENRQLLRLLPDDAILTPHPKEFQRLLGRGWQDDYEKIYFLQDFSQKYEVIVVLKGMHTAVALPNGEIHFNSTGNPGMATGGSGDVLTGVITALLAQGYSPKDAAIIGVYEHGRAGDYAAAKRSQTSLIAGDLVEGLFLNAEF